MTELILMKNMTCVAIARKRALCFLLMLLPFSVVADSDPDIDLTPQIQADLYFIQTEAYIREKDYEAAQETLEKIVVLNEQYSLPDEFYYKYANVLHMARHFEEAITSLERYFRLTEQSGKYYQDALTLYHSVIVGQDKSARDDAAYRKARDEGSAAALRGYLNDHSEGNHADEVQRLLEEMEADTAAERDRQEYDHARSIGTTAALREYLNKYPKGNHANEVQRLLEEMEANTAAVERDRQAYDHALDIGTAAAFREYLSKYPQGTHVDEAKAQAEYLKPGREFHDCEYCPKMVVVDAGSYMMGSRAFKGRPNDNEMPRHSVRIERPFAVGVYEVKFDEFRHFVNNTEYLVQDKCWTYRDDEWKQRGDDSWTNPGYMQTDKHPVVCINWNDTRAYANWLSDETTQTYRLLSEAEWEYVARAGTTTRFHYGETILTSQANYEGDHAVPVGKYERNAFGLYDVHGNVWEWVEDCWNESYEGAPIDGTSWEDGDCSRRLLRGGSWNVGEPEFVRSAIRGRNEVEFRGTFNGFRVVRVL